MALVGKVQDMHDDHVYMCIYYIWNVTYKYISIKKYIL